VRRSIDECPVKRCWAHVTSLVDSEEIHEGALFECDNGHKLVAWVEDGKAWLEEAQ
jgi:hypothetical protein